jgi:hypothetical protein
MADSTRDLTPRRGPLERLATWWRGGRKEVRPGSKEARPSSRPRRKKRDATREDFARFALETADTIEAEGNPVEMHRCTYKLIRSELFERAWELRMRAAAMQQPSPIPEWNGSDLTGKTILVRAYTPRDRVGEELRLARFIAPVAKQARRCIVLAEPRLVALLARSFPGVEVRPRGVDDNAAFAEADVDAYYETVAFQTAKDAEQVRRSFVPLRADPAVAEKLRQRYRVSADGPLIGIAWGSSNSDKALPDLKSWSPLLSWPSANFVSLQYGDIARDLEVLQELAGGRIIRDTSIDQLVDLDGFAAQIAALDAVVAISNTTVDMAGMLGGPTVHIRDDNLSSAIWPRSGPTPLYPDMIMLYKQRRLWSEVLAEARGHLEKIVATKR